MSNEFLPADVGREVTAGGGLAVITAYTDGEHVTADVIQPFPATAFDSGDWTILGSPMATCTPSAATPVGAAITLTLDVAGWRASDVGRYVQINGGLCKITSYTSTTIVTAVIESELNAAVAAPPLAWTLEGSVWGGKKGYPRCGTLHEQRLFAAGSPGFPQSVWGSVIGEYFDMTLGSNDADAVSFVVANGEINPILHLASVRGLVALTTGGEFSINGGSDRPITPTNVQVKDQSAHGCSGVAPARIGNELFFPQRARRKIRALSSNQYDSGQYNAPDMSVLSEHITESGVVGMAYQSEPTPLLWVVRGDGQMATLTADRDQDVFAWARQVTQGSFESVATVPVADGYRVFAVVSRVIDGQLTRYIEMLEPGLQTDSAVTGTSEAGATTWTGLGHLEGMRVRVKGDGIKLTDRVVEGGAITIERPAKAIEIGLDYVTTIKTLRPEFSVPVGTIRNAKVNVFEAGVELLDSIGCTINLQQVAFQQFDATPFDQAPQPFSGMKSVGNLGWETGPGQVLIQQTLPYPFHVLAVVMKVTANEG